MLQALGVPERRAPGTLRALGMVDHLDSGMLQAPRVQKHKRLGVLQFRGDRAPGPGGAVSCRDARIADAGGEPPLGMLEEQDMGDATRTRPW